jgi:hypothetical protein
MSPLETQPHTIKRRSLLICCHAHIAHSMLCMGVTVEKVCPFAIVSGTTDALCSKLVLKPSKHWQYLAWYLPKKQARKRSTNYATQHANQSPDPHSNKQIYQLINHPAKQTTTLSNQPRNQQTKPHRVRQGQVESQTDGMGAIGIAFVTSSMVDSNANKQTITKTQKRQSSSTRNQRK